MRTCDDSESQRERVGNRERETDRQTDRQKEREITTGRERVMNMKLPLNQSDVSFSLPRKLVIIRRKPCKKQPLGNG